jgi:3-oxoacyl-[acyl-carrier protein] reductase|tara:strand:+ start:138 stop:896 length:759 start_codon:yes stop_codon:yes gene_type:complete
MDLQLKGRTCLITGASRGLGEGAAKALAGEGCRVAIVARRKKLLEELADEIEANGSERPFIVAEDLTEPDAPNRIRDAVYDAFGDLEIIVNSAGGSRAIPWDAGDEIWQEGMALNFEIHRRLTTLFLPKMREQQWGRVINVTGPSEPLGLNVASVAKAAFHVWAKGLSRAVAGDGITINSVAPGRFNTEQILERLHADPDERRAFIEAHIPIGYFGEPEDMANLIAFLASPRARYITGEVINVDGGMRAFAY